ncbi:MAG TPA: hypothetical protein VN920_15160, partial [Pyrinomonadaceae bacterium]|nr:hypothetical protein [Pyrinomonadaceae bacterium]
MANLFLRHHAAFAKDDEDSVGSGWENEFTEILAFYLSCDSEACGSLCQTILGSDYDTPIGVSTQHSSQHGIPDVAIQLLSGRLLFIENKIDAPLGELQLERYLKICDEAGNPGFVALFAKKNHRVVQEVVASPFYKHPASRDHYRWVDLYNIIPAAGDDQLGVAALRGAYREYLRFLGFAPTNLTGKWPLLFENRLEPSNREVQVEFGNRLEGVDRYLRDLGFRVTKVSYMGLQARPIAPSPYLFLDVYPARAATSFVRPEEARLVDGPALVVAIVYDMPEPPEDAAHLIDAFQNPFIDSQGRQWCATGPRQFSSGHRTKIEFVSSLQWFLEDDLEMAIRLERSCKSVVSRILEEMTTVTSSSYPSF